MKPSASESLTLILSRVIGAPRARVFAAFASVDELKKWFGPEECHVTDGEMELRPGGAYRLGMVTKQFGRADLTGTFREVVVNERLSFTWRWRNNPAMDSWGEMLVTIQFADHPDGTQVTIAHEGILSPEIREGHAHGWNGSFDKLTGRFGGPPPASGPARARQLLPQTEIETKKNQTRMATKAKQFLLLTRGGADPAAVSPEVRQQMMESWMKWLGELKKKKKLKHCNPLDDGGKLLSGRKGAAVTAFVEHADSVGGCIMLQAANLAEATRLAKGCPILDRAGTVEVRPVHRM